MTAHLLAQAVGDRRRRASRPRGSRCGGAAGSSIGYSSAIRPGRLDSRTTRSPRRTASRTLWVTNSTVSRWRSTAPRARRAAGRASSRRARRTARPSGARCAALGEGPGERRRAGACRPRARAGVGRRSSRGGRCSSSLLRPGSCARPSATPASFRASSTLPRDGEPREERRLLEHQRGRAGADVDRARTSAGRGRRRG